jgi:tetratricopeptide (TPR) repeat protein
MTLQLPNDFRRIIPRWRNSRVALTTGELVISRVSKLPIIRGFNDFNQKLQSWLEKPTIETASELVSAGISENFPKESINAAEFLLDNKNSIVPAVLSLAENVLIRGGKVSKEELSTLTPIEKQELRLRIHDFRRRLIDYPRNPLMWVDLSRAYIVVGEWSKAKKAMANALFLSPTNRFVLRSVARLYVHLDDPEQALYFLSKSEIVRNDPWLLAAEIATANVAGITSKFIRRSREILDRKNNHPFHVTELSSALATLELNSGSNKKARKLFQSSLDNPTENSVAQSAWAKRFLPTLELGNTITTTPRTYEAQAWNSYLAQDWKGVVEASTDWLLDEPFSSRPAELGSYAASIGLEDYERAVIITRNGLIANPNDHGLINNHAFALANQDKLVDALKILKTATRPAPDPSSEVALLATEGFIDLKLGKLMVGKNKYLEAISLADKKSLYKISASKTIKILLPHRLHQRRHLLSRLWNLSLECDEWGM